MSRYLSNENLLRKALNKKSGGSDTNTKDYLFDFEKYWVNFGGTFNGQYNTDLIKDVCSLVIEHWEDCCEFFRKHFYVRAPKYATSITENSIFYIYRPYHGGNDSYYGPTLTISTTSAKYVEAVYKDGELITYTISQKIAVDNLERYVLSIPMTPHYFMSLLVYKTDRLNLKTFNSKL